MAAILLPKQQQFRHYTDKGVSSIIQSPNISQLLKEPMLQDLPQPSSIVTLSDDDEEPEVGTQMRLVTPAEKRAASSRKRKFSEDHDFFDSVSTAIQPQSGTKRRSLAPAARVKDQGMLTNSVSSSRIKSSGRMVIVPGGKHLNVQKKKKKRNRIVNSDSEYSDFEDELILIKMKERRKVQNYGTTVAVDRAVNDSGEKESCSVNDLYVSNTVVPAVSRRLPHSTQKVEGQSVSKLKPANSKVMFFPLSCCYVCIGAVFGPVY